MRTPTNNFFVNYYGQLGGLDESTWRIGIAGLVAHPQSLTVADLKARERREVDTNELLRQRADVRSTH